MLIWPFSGSALLLSPPPSSPCPRYPFPKEEEKVPRFFFPGAFLWGLGRCKLRPILKSQAVLDAPPSPNTLLFAICFWASLLCWEGDRAFVLSCKDEGSPEWPEDCPRSWSWRRGGTFFTAVSATPPCLSHIRALSRSLWFWVAVGFLWGKERRPGSWRTSSSSSQLRARSVGWTQE